MERFTYWLHFHKIIYSWVSVSCLDAFDPTYLRDCNHGRYEKRYFFNAERKRCEVFYYGGCTSASKNIFEDYDACRNLCENPDKHLTRICEQPFQAESDDECSEDGRRVQRYYYNQKKNHCEMFWSRNCRRNSENVFTSLATCKWLCERENDGLLPSKDCFSSSIHSFLWLSLVSSLFHRNSYQRAHFNLH
ncbi:hypothetical protein AB6A40_011619 [Gnathostoma spinigerum]|uniref:BPTI/Kunitz inhibitor domain-containing protein n=1 Tax=Gnathostoma spinigerum TaxID=75299 RepID=A0ABD6EZI0_9BILA